MIGTREKTYYPSVSADASAAQRQIVHIIGSGHSGSTLLDMILGGHSQVSALGEAYFLHFNLRNFREYDICTCGRHVTKCPFWARVEEQARHVLHTDCRPALMALQLADERLGNLMDESGRFHYRRPGQSPMHVSRAHQALLLLGSYRAQTFMSRFSSQVAYHRQIARDMVQLYELVRRAHRTPIILDSTKNPGTFKNIYLHADSRMRFLHVIRDGRAVCRSRMRREGVTMEQAARIWKAEQVKRRLSQMSIPQKRILKVHYEYLASRPEETTREVCAFLGIDFEPRMLEFREERHNLGGNPMRFRRSEQTIRLDEAWRRDLNPDDLRTFDNIAGSLNRRFGYT